jgi:hypothetical protein
MVLKYILREWLSTFEGKHLPDRFSTSEQLAYAIWHDLDKCVRVEVRRHAEGIIAIYPPVSW